MKKTLLIILSFLSITTFAQSITENDWYDLSTTITDIRIFNLEIDFSEATILNWNAADFIASEPEWEEGIKEMRKKFTGAFNDETGTGKYPYRIGTYPDSKCTIIVKPLEVKEKGSHIKALINITNESGEVVFTRVMKGESGVFGTTVNLMGDAMEDLGENLGEKIHAYGKPGLSNFVSNKPASGSLFQRKGKASKNADGE